MSAAQCPTHVSIHGPVRRALSLAAILVSVWLMTGCGPGEPAPTPTPVAAPTALATPTASATSTRTPVPPTATPSPPTHTPSPTHTSIPVTLSPTLPPTASPPLETRLEVVLDDGSSGFGTTGQWYVGDGEQSYDGACHWAPRGPENIATWQPLVPFKASYEVFAWWCGDPNSDQSTAAVFEITYSGAQSQRVPVNLQEGAGQWHSLGTYPFDAGVSGRVRIHGGYDYNVVADAIKLVFRGIGGPPAPPTPAPAATPLVSHNPPSPLEQLSKGDLGRRLHLNQGGFYAATAFEGTPMLQTFEDCKVFSGPGCDGLRNGWRVNIRYGDMLVTYLVAEDYHHVVVEPSEELAVLQRIFLIVQRDALIATVDRQPDGSWRLFSNQGHASNLGEKMPEDLAALQGLVARYSSIVSGADADISVTLYGLGGQARLEEADQVKLDQLADRLIGALQ